MKPSNKGTKEDGDSTRDDRVRDGGSDWARPAEDPHRSIVERVQAEAPYGTTAFQELVDVMGPAVFQRARRILGSSSDAEDVVQEVFLRVFRSIPGFRFDRPFLHWIQVITLNTCRQRLRARRRDQNRRDAFEREPRAPIIQPERDPALRRVLGELLEEFEPETRICLVLRLLEDWSYAEIAAHMDVNEATARKRVQRGSDRLRRRYAERIEK